MRVLLVRVARQPTVVVEELLRARGHAVATCETTESALARWAEQPCPLIVLTDGLEVAESAALCRATQSLPRGRRPVVLALLANADPAAATSLLEAGASDVCATAQDPTLLAVRLAVAERLATEAVERAQIESVDALLHEIDRRVLRGQATDHVLPFICSGLAEVFGYPLVWIGTREPDGGVRIHTHAGAKAQAYLTDFEVRWDDTPEGRGPTGLAIRSGRTQLFDVEDPAFRPWRDRARLVGFRRCVTVPLRVKDQVLGTLAMYDERPDGFDTGTVRRLENLADRISLTLLMAVEQQQLRLQGAAMASAGNAIAIADYQGRIEWVNAAFTRLSGYSPEEIIGRSLGLLRPSRRGELPYGDRRQGDPGDGVWQGEVVNCRKDGSLYTVVETVTPLKDAQGRVTHFVAIHEDVTAQRQAEARIHHLAHYDVLTGLPNRAFFQERLRYALEAARQDDRMVATLFVDLDRFKGINDSLGHMVGDWLLQAVAKRLLQSVRESDVVARLGGDEFTIIVPGVARPHGAALVAEKLLGALRRPFRLEGQEIFCGASIGIALFPRDGASAEELIAQADTAMSRAKEQGRNGYRFYSPDMNGGALHRLLLENGLRKALDRDELILHYQALVELPDWRIAGFEALVRWQHPEFGLVSPAEFIPIAEDTGLIVPLGEWVLHTACAQARAWHEDGLGPLRVSVNVSARQFQQGNLAQVVARALAESGLEARLLELELTEGSIMQNAPETVGALGELKALGVQLAVDDFGTGYSSLGYLKRFPIDRLKIDRSFVRDLTRDADDAAIVRAIIALAHSLKRQVTAEGVEDEAQAAFLRAHGCDEIQGYLVSRPVLADEAARLLEGGRVRMGA